MQGVGTSCPALCVTGGTRKQMTFCGVLLCYVVQDHSGGAMLAMPQHECMAGWSAPIAACTPQGDAWGTLGDGSLKRTGLLRCDQVMAEAMRVSSAPTRDVAIHTAAYGTELVIGAIIDALKPPPPRRA